MEAALRTAYEIVTGKELKEVEFKKVRGWEGIREAEIELNGSRIKVAVAHGLSNAARILEKIKKGVSDYHFVEVMACPGGRAMGIRKSHENPAIRKLYEEFLGEPLGEKSHHLLHTHYKKRGVKVF